MFALELAQNGPATFFFLLQTIDGSGVHPVSYQAPVCV